jgi:hypothetical protein
MAEIKDVYSLEFNSSQFQTEINSAIQSIDQLNSAMEQGVDVADELEEAQANLVNVLGTEAKGVEQLNQKRNVLVNTQKQVNAESKTGVTVGRQLDTTNKQIAVSTGQAATQQRGLGQTLLSGTRAIGQMRRVTSTLTFAFRALSAALPFGLIMSFAGPIIDFFGSLFKSTDNTADNMEKLNDTTLSLSERIGIAEIELEKLNAIESNRGQLTEEEEKRRRELTKTYEETSKEIVRIEQERADKIREIEFALADARVQLLGDTAQGVIEAADLQNKKLYNEINKRFDDLVADNFKIQDEIKKAEEEFTRTSNADASIRASRLRTQLQSNADAQVSIIEEQRLRELAIEKQKNDRLAQIAEKARQDRIKEIQNEIKELEKLNQFRIDNTVEGSKERYQAELNAINLVQDAYEKYAKELGITLLDLELMFAENAKKRNDIDTKRIENIEKVKQAELESIRQMRQAYEEELQNQRKIIDAGTEYRVNNAEADLALQLLELEAERNQKLDAAFLNVEMQEKIDEEYNRKRQILEANVNQKIIKIRIDALKKLRDASGAEPAELAALNKQINELELKYEELNKVTIDANKQILKGAIDNNKKTTEEGEKTVKGLTDKQKELIDQTTQLIQGVSDNVFNVLNAQVQAYIEGLDKAIDKSKSALDEIRSNSENYNARQLEIEKERLEKLEAERARAVEREKNLASVQLAINAAIAISKAAAEGGAAAPITIALTLASLIAGLAQARVAAGNAFYHGVEYLERGQNKAGRDTIPAMLNEGERVITTDTNNKYWDVLSAVHNNRIPADVLNTFSKAYQQGGIKNALGAFGDNVSLSSELGQKSIFVNVAQTYGGLENRLERIENVLTELPKYMPRTTVSANANGIFRIVEQRQARKNFSKNWSK